MELLPLICLHALCAGGLLVQSPPTVSVTPGSKVSLSCDITDMRGRCSEVVWLRFGQASGLSVSSQFASGGHSRTLSSRNNLCLLEISSAALQDAGRYYCVYINGVMLLTGDGTTLTVTESVLHSPAVNLLLPSDTHVNSSLPIPLVCLVSGLEDTGRVTVDWEVDWEREDADGLQELSPRILPDREAGVVGVQVYVPGETWMGGAEVSCVLTDGELKIRKTVSSRKGKSTECVFLTSILGVACVVLFAVTVTLSILLSWRQRGQKRKSDGPTEIREEASADLHYAALTFEASGRRNIRLSHAPECR